MTLFRSFQPFISSILQSGAGKRAINQSCRFYSAQQSNPTPNTKAFRYAGWTLTAAGGYGIGVAYSRYTRQTVSSDINADGPGAPDWSTFTLHDRHAISPTVSIFTFKSTQPVLPSTYYDSLFESSIFAVDIAQPQIQIVREYTPLPPAIDPATHKALLENDCAELHLLIRKEPRGEVSTYVHTLPDGAEVRISRPRPQVSLEKVGGDRDVHNLVMVVGGTGITAALQAIHAVLETRDDGTHTDVSAKPFVHVLWANRRREDCLGGVSDTTANGTSWWNVGGWFGATPGPKIALTELGVSPVVDELRRLKEMHGERLKIDYFVDEEGSYVTTNAIAKALADKPKGKTYIAVSGPEGFMVNLAGEKRMLKNRITARPSTGMLAGLKQSNWELMVLG